MYFLKIKNFNLNSKSQKIIWLKNIVFSEILFFWKQIFHQFIGLYWSKNDIGKTSMHNCFYINNEMKNFLSISRLKINKLSSLKKKGRFVDFNNSQPSEFWCKNDRTDNGTSYFNKNLSINSFYRIWSDYSCHPIEDILPFWRKKEGISRIYICADLKIMVEPTLQFKRPNLHLNLMKVWQRSSKMAICYQMVYNPYQHIRQTINFLLGSSRKVKYIHDNLQFCESGLHWWY